MKKLLIITLMAGLFFPACSNKCVEDLGTQSSTEIALKVYDEIDVQGAIKLVLVQDSTYRIRIQADSNMLKHVKADVNSGKLKLKINRDYCGSDSVVIRAGIGELKKLTTAGAVQVTGEGKVNTGDLNLILAGNTNLSLELNAARVTTRIDGIAEVNLMGQAGAHQLDTKGNVKINAFDFVVGVYDIDIDGVGKANINVLNTLKTETSGSSEIYYRGNPKKVDEKKSGAATLQKVN